MPLPVLRGHGAHDGPGDMDRADRYGAGGPEKASIDLPCPVGHAFSSFAVSRNCNRATITLAQRNALLGLRHRGVHYEPTDIDC